MSEIEARIGAWRTRLQAVLPDREETVRELEEHLRDEIDALQARGLNAVDAFARAEASIGEPAVIAREFERMGAAWLPAPRPALVLLVLLACAVTLVGALLVSDYLAGKWTLLFVAHVFTITAGYLSVLGTGLIGGCALLTAWRRPLTRREHGELRHLLFRLTVVSGVLVPVGMILGMAWAGSNLGRAWSNSPVELGAAVILVSIILSLIVQTRTFVDHRVRWLLAVAGNIALILGWMWARAATPAVPIAWLSLALITSQVAIMLLPQRKTTAQVA